MNYRNLISFIERSSIEQLYNFYEIHSREFAWGGTTNMSNVMSDIG